jgi:hypothetical protein
MLKKLNTFMLTIENFIPYSALAVLPGPRVSFLDHLIPMCHFWDIPVLCTDAWVFTCAQTFYPPTQILFAGQSDFQQILSNYQTFLTVEPCRLHPKAFKFGEFLYQGEGCTIAGFHGNPAKFRDAYWIERYADEDLILLYGQYLVDYFKEKGAWSRLKKTALLGNLRKTFYEKHKFFFDRVAQPYLFPKNHKRTLLWAPTWSYPEWQDPFSALIEKLPADFQLMLKFHPFTHRLFPEKVNALIEKYRDREGVLILEEIPLVYPLLDQADIYLGDMSSMAYDFLSYDRPLFLMGGNSYPWATTVDPQSAFKAFGQKDLLSEERQKIYRYVYGTL